MLLVLQDKNCREIVKKELTVTYTKEFKAWDFA